MIAAFILAAVVVPVQAAARPFLLLRGVADTRIIVDPAAIEVVPGGAVRRMWTVTVQPNIRNETPPQPGYVRAINDYDCANQKTRWRSFSVFSRSGAALLSRENASNDWIDVVPDSGIVGEWRVACGLSRGDSAIEADSIAKVVIAFMKAFDPPAPQVADPPKPLLPAAKPKATAGR